MFAKLRFCFLLLTFCFGSSVAFAASTYKLVDLGLQESDRSEALAINDNDQVAGIYWMQEKKYYFLWNMQKGITLIDLPETATIAVLNNAGQIAGNYKDCSGKDRGFIWDTCCGFFDIGTLGGSFTRIYGMNDLGLIVGLSESSNISLVDGVKEQHAFLWQRGCMIHLGALSGDLGLTGDRSVATSINNHGHIIGTSNYLIAHKRKFLRSNSRAVCWRNGAIEETDPSLEPQYNPQALSVNNNGLAIYDSKDGYHVVDLATKNKKKIPLSQNLGRDPVISDNDDIYFYGKEYSGANKKMPADIVLLKKKKIEAFSENLDSYENIYLPYSFENPKDWKPGNFSGAFDFNNKRWIVGVDVNIYGESHGVLLIPINE